MKRPRVLLDCDGVLSDFVSEALATVDRVTCRSRPSRPEEVTQFDFCEALGLAPEERRAVHSAIAGDLEFASRLRPYPAALAGVTAVRELADVYVVTQPWNTNPCWTYHRELWLWRNFGISPERVIHASAKHAVLGQLLVDDAARHLEAWREEHPHGEAVHWLTPHNRSERWSGRRSDSWDYVVSVTGSLQ